MRTATEVLESIIFKEIPPEMITRTENGVLFIDLSQSFKRMRGLTDDIKKELGQ